MTYGAARCANCITASLYRISTTIFVLAMEAIEADLAVDPCAELLLPLSSDNTSVNTVRINKTFYLPDHYVGMFLEQDVTPSEVWIRLRGATVNTREKVEYQPITYWIQVALTRNIGNEQPSPISIPWPTAPLVDRELLMYQHNVLVFNLPGCENSLQHAQCSLIATHISELAVKICQDQEEKARFSE